MSIKMNDATPNRPDGLRVIDAPAVQVNFNDYVKQLKSEKAWENSDRNAITVFKTHGVTVVISALHKNAEINDMEIDGLLMLQVMDGSLTISSEGNSTTLGNKQMLVLHQAPASCITAEEDCILQLSYIKTITKPEESVI